MSTELIDSLKSSKAQLSNKMDQIKEELRIKKISSRIKIDELQEWISNATETRNEIKETIEKLATNYKVRIAL